MLGSGKYFEKLVMLIENVTKEHEYIDVSHNRFIIDRNGRKRQIDVLIESDWGRLGKQRVIIECKEWERLVGIDQVEAFITKIDSLGVNKGIIVSRNGFQKGAKETAIGTTRVDLYTLENINIEQLEDLIMFPVLKIGYRILSGEINTTLALPNNGIDFSDYNGKIFYKGEIFADSILDFSTKMIKVYEKTIFKRLFEMRAEMNESGDGIWNSMCELSVESEPPLHYLTISGVTHEISGFDIQFGISAFNEKSGYLTPKLYKSLNSKDSTILFSAEFNDSKLEIVSDKDGELRYFEITKETSEIIEYKSY